MDNAARIDDLWGDSIVAPTATPYLETNRWLEAVIPTECRSRRPVSQEQLDFLGIKIVWTRDGSGRFPQPVLECLVTLLKFDALEENWDSYSGKSLSRGAVPRTLELIFYSHQRGEPVRLVPLGDGGVGLRWSRDAHELEIDVSSVGEIEGLFESPAILEPIELLEGTSLSEAFGLIDQFVAKA